MLPVRRQKTGEAMIQEGFAEKLNISYSVPEGIKESKVLLYRYLDKAVYVKQKNDDAAVLPDLEEVVKAIAEEAELVTGGSLSDGSSGPAPIYMFSIGETAFYTLAEEYLTAYTSLVAMNLATVELRFFRRSENRIYNFAASTGWQIYKWYIENRFCGRCGCNMLPGKTERSMVCSKCGMTVYPKIMPAVIVGVTNGDKILITRYKGRAYKGHALIAGFCEIGETAEDTVRREVMEESGLKVKNIRYYKSQPWGFDQDLLLGFFCDVDGSDDIKMDEGELSEAVWLDRSEIDDAFENMSLTNEMIVRFKEGVKV